MLEENHKSQFDWSGMNKRVVLKRSEERQISYLLGPW